MACLSDDSVTFGTIVTMLSLHELLPAKMDAGCLVCRVHRNFYIMVPY